MPATSADRIKERILTAAAELYADDGFEVLLREVSFGFCHAGADPLQPPCASTI